MWDPAARSIEVLAGARTGRLVVAGLGRSRRRRGRWRAGPRDHAGGAAAETPVQLVGCHRRGGRIRDARRRARAEPAAGLHPRDHDRRIAGGRLVVAGADRPGPWGPVQLRRAGEPGALRHPQHRPDPARPAVVGRGGPDPPGSSSGYPCFRVSSVQPAEFLVLVAADPMPPHEVATADSPGGIATWQWHSPAAGGRDPPGARYPDPERCGTWSSRSASSWSARCSAASSSARSVRPDRPAGPSLRTGGAGDPRSVPGTTGSSGWPPPRRGSRSPC